MERRLLWITSAGPLGFAHHDRVITIADLADDLGLIEVHQLRRAGLTSLDVSRLVRRGELLHLRRCWYAVSPPTDSAHHHLRLLSAVERTYGGTATASHHSELLRLGLPLFDGDLGTVHLVRTVVGAQHRHRRGLMVHRPVPAEAVLPTGRIQPALAVVQHGLTGSGVGALCAADAALRQGLATGDDLATALAWVKRHPRSGRVAAYLNLADGRSESVGESRLRFAFHLLGIDVTPQVTISDAGFRARVDFLVTGTRVVVEFDGAQKYTGPQVLLEEKSREDRLRALGYLVLRVRWADLGDLKALERKIRRAMALAA